MIAGQATAKYVRTSAQKAGLVLALIRGADVNQALASLRYSRKKVARDIEKVLRSAIANAQQKPGFSGDVERLYVSACSAGQGPSQRRVRPAPMGRAYRVVKRTAHLTVAVAERAEPAPRPAPKAGKTGKAAKGTEAPPAPKAGKAGKAAKGTEAPPAPKAGKAGKAAKAAGAAAKKE
jgi:large subunit ribosomal protein L22